MTAPATFAELRTRAHAVAYGSPDERLIDRALAAADVEELLARLVAAEDALAGLLEEAEDLAESVRSEWGPGAVDDDLFAPARAILPAPSGARDGRTYAERLAERRAASA